MQLGTQLVQLFGSIPGLGQIAGLASDIIGAFGLADQQEAYNRALMKLYDTPQSQGGLLRTQNYRPSRDRRTGKIVLGAELGRLRSLTRKGRF